MSSSLSLPPPPSSPRSDCEHSPVINFIVSLSFRRSLFVTALREIELYYRDSWFHRKLSIIEKPAPSKACKIYAQKSSSKLLEVKFAYMNITDLLLFYHRHCFKNININLALTRFAIPHSLSAPSTIRRGRTEASSEIKTFPICI